MTITSAPTLWLNPAQTERALDTASLMPALRHALIAISRDEVSAPPRVSARAPNGVLGAMPAYVPGLGLAAKLVSVFPTAVAGRSVHDGAVVLFDEHDGRPLLLLGAGPLTAVRTAATALLAMQVLAHTQPRQVAVLGAGMQARAQLQLLAAQVPTVPVLVASRDAARAADAARVHPLGIAVGSVADAARDADVVFCCTDADAPILGAGDLAPATLLCSVGGSRGPEFDPAIAEGADVYVEWRGAATERPPAGAHELQGLAAGEVIELGALLDEQRTVNARGGDRLTVFKSTGHGALDVAAARVAFDQAQRLGLGAPITL